MPIKLDSWDWLQNYLAILGRTETSTVIAAAKAAGYTKSDLKLARMTCNVKTEHDRESGLWYWSLRP